MRFATIKGMELRVMTYNIGNGRGVDGQVNLERIAEVIASFDPDVVTVQEVDVCRSRTGGLDQAVALADHLDMEVLFVPCMRCDDAGHYGLATFTRWPIAGARMIKVTGDSGPPEPLRAFLVELVRPDGQRLNLVNAHLSVRSHEPRRQVTHLVDSLGSGDVIVAGDLSCSTHASALPELAELECATPAAPTWPAQRPMFQRDQLLYRGELDAQYGGTWNAAGAHRASNHLPVVASFTFPSTQLH